MHYLTRMHDRTGGGVSFFIHNRHGLRTTEVDNILDELAEFVLQ